MTFATKEFWQAPAAMKRFARCGYPCVASSGHLRGSPSIDPNRLKPGP